MTKPFDEGRLQAPSHTFQIFNPILFQKTIDQMVVKIEKLRALYPEIEAIAACGMSGLVLAGAVSARLQLPIIAVRKTMDTTHNDRMVNGHLGAKGYLFIDDLICSGKTVDHVIGEIDRAARWYYPEEAPHGSSAACYTTTPATTTTRGGWVAVASSAVDLAPVPGAASVTMRS